MSNVLACSICEHKHNEDDMLFEETSGKIICEGCFDSRNFICEGCNEYFPEEQNKGNNHCDTCFRRKFFQCSNCGDIYSRRTENYANVEGEIFCEDCTDRDCQFCENCDRYYQESHFHSRRYHSCENDDTLHDYNYKPNPKFHGDGNIFYGVELEVECESSTSDTIEKLRDFKTFIYNKRDGSLDDGFEVVSHPATLKYHQDNNWKSILQVLRQNDCRSHDTKTCGLHVHMSKKDMDVAHLKRFILFWYTQDKIVRSIARRDFNSYCTDKDMGRRVIPTDEILRSENRYEQINLQPEDTIEVRRFKGTLNPVTFFACIELVDAVRKYTKTTTYKDMRNEEFTEQTFIGWVFKHKNTYPNLCKKLKEKIKFVAQDEE